MVSFLIPYYPRRERFLKRFTLCLAIVTLLMLVLRLKCTYPTIFFVETKLGKQRPTSVDSCAIESAARIHPRSQIIVYKTNQMYDPEDQYVKMLRTNFPNVHFVSADLERLFGETPLHEWHLQDRISESRFPEEHLSDAIRIALIWKYGGIYLDTDVIALKSLNGLTNTIGLEYGNKICNAVLVFDKQFPFIFRYMQRFVRYYNGQSFDFQGPVMIAQMFKEMCRVELMRDLVNRPSSCLGIDVQPANRFYPVEYINSMKYFEDSDVDFSDSLTTHIYRSGLNGSRPRAGSKSLLSRITNRYCPSTHRLMLKDGVLQNLFFQQT